MTDLATAERALPAVVAGAGLGLRRLEVDEVSFEEVFVELVGERPVNGPLSSFAAKEGRETVRTWRLWVLPGILVFLALSSPVLTS